MVPVALSAPLSSESPLQLLGPPREEPQELKLPLAASTVAAGFPSPADDYIDVGIDLNETLIRHPSSTCLLYTSPSPRDATLSRMPSSA